MEEEILKILNKDSRQDLYALWNRAKEGDFDGLSVEEDRMAWIMLDHHDAIHFVGQILICLIFDVMEHKRPFDLETYRHLLKKY